LTVLVPEEEPGQIYMPPRARPMKRGRTVLVLGVCVGAVLDQEPGQMHITP